MDVSDILDRMEALAFDLRNSNPPCNRVMNLLTDHLVPGDGVVQPREMAGMSMRDAQQDDDDNDTDDSNEDNEEESEAEDGDEDFDDSEDEIDEDYDDDEVVNCLSRLYHGIVAKHKSWNSRRIPGLKPTQALYDHQRHAVGAAVQSLDSQFHGMILADPPGIGKTLPALAAAALSWEPGDGPSVVVAPLSCCRQWMAEIENFFIEGGLPAVCLLGESMSPLDLWKYKIAVTSYSFVSAEVARVSKFLKAVQNYNEGMSSVLPKKPKLLLLSGLLEEANKKVGKWLILDEAHAIKNHESLTYSAIRSLRTRFEGCLMLTATPLDNSWRDGYALLSLLKGHPLTNFNKFRMAFLESPFSRSRTSHDPSAQYLTRYIQLLDAVSLRRPMSTIAANLPEITTTVRGFDLTQQARRLSNEAFESFIKAMKKRSKRRRTREDDDDDDAGWRHLIIAQQHAFHPMLIELKLARDTFMSSMKQNELADAIPDEDAGNELRAWTEKLQRDGNWRSRRVDAVVDTVKQHKDRYPEDSFLIVDESICFLDIVAVALQREYEPEDCDMYNGRLDTVQRHFVIKKAFDAKSPFVLLASRGTGGQGLNMQCANVLIRCGPWWKASWEERATGRIWRPGQTKPVFVYELRARHCKVESYTMKVRDRKNKLNTLIQKAFTRADDDDDPSPRFIS